jgi:hypothetical protein
MKIELSIALSSEEELSWLDYGLESILEKTNHNVNTTLYLSRITNSLLHKSLAIAEKYDINFEPRGDNSPLQYLNESKHRAFDINDADCTLCLQPDTAFSKNNVFDSIMDEASEYFDSKYIVCVSSDHPDDTTPLALNITTKLGWKMYGCDDINFSPHTGTESDLHRRCYLAYGLDPNDKEAYMGPLDGKITPPWIHRIKNKDFLHIGKPWMFHDSRVQHERLISYALHTFYGCVVCDRWFAYYVEKWGNLVGDEIFVHPFDDENNSIKIEWENSTNPYPETKYLSLRGQMI